MGVVVDAPDRIWTNELVVAVRVVGVGTGVGTGVGVGVGVDEGVAEGVGLGEGVWAALSSAIRPRCPMAKVASVRPTAARVRTMMPIAEKITRLMATYW